MDSPKFSDDDVIADSEDELERNYGAQSSVSAFTATNYHQAQDHSKAVSSISEFLRSTPTFPEGKGVDLSTNFTADRSADIEGISGTLNITDRQKSDHRGQKQAEFEPTSDIIELSCSDDNDELNLKPSKVKTKEKTKPNQKQKESVKTKDKENLVSSNTYVEPPSDAPTTKQRPRPRPVLKLPKTKLDTPGGVANPFHQTSNPPPISNNFDLPIATSPSKGMQSSNQSRLIHQKKDTNTYLPPSDPPISSIPSIYGREPAYVHPRIETLPNSAGDGRSSPSSFSNELGTRDRVKKRKRAKWDIGDPEPEVDELAPSSEGAPINKVSPPPTFFAGSSSSSIGADRRGRGNVLPHDHLPDLYQEPVVVDLTNLPSTLDVVSNKRNSLIIKPPKKPGKKNTTTEMVYNDEELMMMPPPIVVLDEDEMDEDFNPSGVADIGKKKKKSSNAKEKGSKKATVGKVKAKANSAQATGNRQLEVAIPLKNTKAKNKGKVKTTAKQKEDKSKEIFKSREFIEDSDEESEPLPPPAVEIGTKPSAGSSSSGAPLTSPLVLAVSKSNPDATPLVAVVAPGSLKAKSPARRSDFDSDPKFDSELSDLPADMINSDPPSSVLKQRKRKVISSEDEDGEYNTAVANPDSMTFASLKKQKKEDAGIKPKAKGKNIVLSDEEENEAITENKNHGKKKKAAKERQKAKSSKPKKVARDEEDEADIEVEVEAERHPDVEEDPLEEKENVVPANSKTNNLAALQSVSARQMHTSTQAGDKRPIYEQYEIAPRKSSLPMSELIRRANSMPGSPFSPALTNGSTKLKPLMARTPSSTAYSPYLKSSRSLLSRIAPLHPNRRTPPPPPPPPPPRKKTKKELEMEEKWEEEMVDSVGGVEVWAAMGDDERREMRKAKWAREMGGWDD